MICLPRLHQPTQARTGQRQGNLRPNPLNETEKRSLEHILENPDLMAALERVCDIEAFAWKTRLVNEAMNLTSDPLAKCVKQAEYAARAKALEEFVELIRRKVYQRGLEAVT